MSENGCNIFTVMYKYAMLMCNCRRTFEPLQSSPGIKVDTAISNGSLADTKADYTELDKLLNGSDRDKQKAYNILKERANVSHSSSDCQKLLSSGRHFGSSVGHLI